MYFVPGDDREVRRVKAPPVGVRAQTAAPEPIWDDHTPPPARLPDESEREQRDALERIRTLEHAIEHEKRARHEAKQEGREMGAIVEKLGTLATEVNKLDGLQDRVQSIATGQDRADGKVERLLIGFEVQEQREAARDKRDDRFFEIVGSHGTRLSQVETKTEVLGDKVATVATNLGDKTRTHEARFDNLEQRLRLTEQRSKVTRALTLRQRAESGGLGAAAGALAGPVVSWLAAHLAAWLHF